MTRVLVCGGRDFNDFKLLNFTLDQWHSRFNFTLLIHGNAIGADRMSGAWAVAKGIAVDKYPADWEVHGRSAGPRRNMEMLAKGKPDLVLAFKGGAGTGHMIRIARGSGVEVVEIK